MFDLPIGEGGQMMAELLCRWKIVFSLHGIEDNHTNDVTHDITNSDQTPVKLPHRRIPPVRYAEIKSHIQDILNAGHIYPCHSPWSFPIALVREKRQ